MTRTANWPSFIIGIEFETMTLSPTNQWLLIITAMMLACNCNALAFGPMRPSSDRRSVLNQIVSSTAASLAIFTNKTPALAVAPFAPIDALLPATRVKVMLDRGVDIASNLVAAESMDRKQDMLRDLESLLLVQQHFNRNTVPIEVPQQPAKSYLNAYAEYRNRVSILEKPGAMLIQNGEINMWKELKQQEKAREGGDEIRAALNYYTSNLNFNSDKFVLTGTKEEKSKMIRDDKIPDVKSVITSDMGLRYLLRNDILTACDDARAELKYQMKQNSTVDGQDLLDVLLVAQNACNQWFDLIDDKDTLAALDIVKLEGL